MYVPLVTVDANAIIFHVLESEPLFSTVDISRLMEMKHKMGPTYG